MRTSVVIHLPDDETILITHHKTWRRAREVFKNACRRYGIEPTKYDEVNQYGYVGYIAPTEEVRRNFKWLTNRQL